MQRIKCNYCDSEFYEDKVLYDDEKNKEYCPVCKIVGCLMDIKIMEPKGIIEYYEKNTYGTYLNYIKDKDIAHEIQSLTKKKTIDTLDIHALEQLGFRLIKVMK